MRSPLLERNGKMEYLEKSQEEFARIWLANYSDELARNCEKDEFLIQKNKYYQNSEFVQHLMNLLSAIPFFEIVILTEEGIHVKTRR